MEDQLYTWTVEENKMCTFLSRSLRLCLFEMLCRIRCFDGSSNIKTLFNIRGIRQHAICLLLAAFMTPHCFQSLQFWVSDSII